jgi:hypothetical protein
MANHFTLISMEQYKLSKIEILFVVILILVPIIDLIINFCKIDLGSGYKLMTQDSNYMDILSEHGNGLPASIQSYSYDDNFIVAEQFQEKPRRDEVITYSGVNLDTMYKLGYNISYYWIIDKRRHIRYGPYSYKEFLSKKSKLKVPNDLVPNPIFLKKKESK